MKSLQFLSSPRARHAHFLQEPDWGRFQRSLGRTVIQDSGDGWTVQAILEFGRFASHLYAPYGPVISGPDGLRHALASLAGHARALGAAFVRVEPTGDVTAADLAERGLNRVPQVQPERTMRIGLGRDARHVLAGFSEQDRDLHRDHRAAGMTIRRSSDPDDIGVLLGLLDGAHLDRALGGARLGRAGLRQRSHEHLRAQAAVLVPTGDAAIYIVEVSGRAAAASLVYDDAARRYCAHAATETGYGQLRPDRLLVVQMVLDAVGQRQLEFDFCGLSGPRGGGAASGGAGSFPRSFGAIAHGYAGTWELPVDRISYLAHSLAQRLVDCRLLDRR